MSAGDGAGAETPESLGTLSTESVRPELADLDLLGTPALVELIATDARRAVEAVVAAAPAISRAVEVVTARLAAGGRMLYVGAGTAGRIAVLDAAELGPTFSVPPEVVDAVIAGGDSALRRAAEGAEDDTAAGAAAVAETGITARDVVVGVSASGRTPYVVGALAAARATGAATIAVTCNENSALAAVAEIAIETVVGGEVVAGSSRMNAGTTQKLVLNALSTASMVRLGKTYGNLMIDFRPTNTKLRDRAIRIVAAISGVDAPAAQRALEDAGWDTRLACVVAACGDLPVARRALQESGGHLRSALARLPTPGRPHAGTRAVGGEAPEPR